MRPLSASELLDAWEMGIREPATRRALPLLAAASSEQTAEEIATLSIGDRDWKLLTLREWTFGPHLIGTADCPACGELLEWGVHAAALRIDERSRPLGELTLQIDSYCVSFRLPNTLDLAAVAGHEDAAVAREQLLERCLSTALREGRAIAVEELPEEVAEAVVSRMAEIDPQADIQLDLTCPACAHQWKALFDIEAFFWSEINFWARRVLTEVHRLASAYGWRESDILNLTAWRRQAYLGLISE